MKDESLFFTKPAIKLKVYHMIFLMTEKESQNYRYFLVFMGGNLIVLVEGKYPLSPQVKNKWSTTIR